MIPHACGPVLIVADSGKETVLYTFTGGTDGGYPSAGPVLDAAGNLYGTALNGGDLACSAGLGCGTVFVLKP